MLASKQDVGLYARIHARYVCMLARDLDVRVYTS